MRRRLAPFALASCLAAPLAAQPLALHVHGGGLGQPLTLTRTGPPGAPTLLLMSLGTGPTPLPAPHVSPLDVGLDLLDLSVAIPGFLAPLSGAGALAIALPVPADPVFDGLNLNFQALRIAGPKLAELSNPWRVTFDTPGQTAYALGAMQAARAFATVTPLGDGSVLVAGGGVGTLTGATGLATAERYLPHLEAFAAPLALTTARALHRAVLLQDGRVLLVGGVDGAGNVTATAEVFDPATGTSAQVGGMALPRVGHTATRLPDGRVLVVGGSTSLADATAFATTAQRTTELFDPATLAFTPGPQLAEPKSFHDAVALADGRVLVSGGLTFTSLFGIPIPGLSARAQVYAPATNAFGGNLSMGSARAAHTSILLADGRVLLAGGGSGSILAPTILASCELFTPAANAFSAAASLPEPRALAALVRLADGRVLAAGGAQGDLLAPVAVDALAAYQPGGAGAWSAAGTLNDARTGHGALLLTDGTVGVFGGAGGPTNQALATVEIHQP